jgi:alpha-mannosidase
VKHDEEVAFWAGAMRRYAILRVVAVPMSATTRSVAGRDTVTALRPGDPWPDPAADLIELAGEAAVPWAEPRLLADLDGESLVFVNDRVCGALNARHHYLDPHLAPGTHRLRLEVLPTALMGERYRPPRVRSVTWQEIDRALEATAYDLEVLAEWARLPSLPMPAREHAWAAIHAALQPLRALAPDRESWRVWLARADASGTEEQLRAALHLGEGIAPHLRAVDRTELRSAMAASGRRLRAVYEELGTHFPRGMGRAVLMGHAHIDTAWLWPIGIGHAKAVRTFATAAALLPDHPAARFGASAPEHYQAVERSAPELFTRLTTLVREGRFVPLGAFWVESDANLPGAGSITRQLLYGLRYFAAHFGLRPRVLFLPDSFGYASGLPTLLAAAGIELFCTTKLNWNDTTRFPYVDFTWVGPDGGSVQAHIFGQGWEGYNGAAELGDILATVEGYQRAGGRRAVLYTYGFGDGGGGPTAAMHERLSRYSELPLLPRLEHGAPESLIAQAADMPRYRGPLYLEYHRGTYTSQSWVKHLNRRAEETLAASEALETWLGRAQSPGREADWRILLRGQFHDILPGSSIRPVYGEIEQEWRDLVARAEERLRTAAGRLVPGSADALVVVNRSSQPSPSQALQVAHDVGAVRFRGEPCRTQAGRGGVWVEVPPLEPFGVVVLDVVPPRAGGAPPPTAPQAERSDPRGGTLQFEHGAIRLEIRDAGIAGLWFGGELVTSAAIAAYRQHPEAYDAWEVVTPADREPVPLLHAAAALVADGPLRTAVRLGHRTPEGTEIVEEVAFDRVLGQVEVTTEVRPAERHLVLVYEAHTTLRAPDAVADGLLGTDRHPAVPAGPSDEARFEWPAHAFVDVAEPTLGLAILNDGKYGHAFRDGTLSVTLLTTPLFPDPRADESPAPSRLALVPHTGDWRAAGIDLRARSFSGGLAAALVPAAGGTLAAPVLGLPPGMRLTAFKPAEDGSGEIVCHLLESRGERGRARVRFGLPVEDVWPVDLVDEAPRTDPPLPITFDRPTQTLALAWQPYSLTCLRLRPAGG